MSPIPYQPKHLRLWKLPDNYGGATWEGFYSSGFGRSRDSDCLEETNFQVAWDTLQAISENVQIVREGHWAVGWVEWIAIPADDSPALELADSLRARYESYPCLDEDRLSQAEQEAADTIWRDCYRPEERIEYIRSHRSQFEFRTLADMIGCVRGNYFAGYASELAYG